MALISCSEHPASASRRQAALRSPCAEQCFGSPASSHHCRNRLPKPAAENGLPLPVTRNVRLLPPVAVKISAQFRVNWDLKHAACFLLAYNQNAAAHMLPPHADNVGSSLRSVEQQRHRQPCACANPMVSFEGGDFLLGPGMNLACP